jgi:hypothetical protein
MSMMRKAAAVLLMCSGCAVASAAQVYKWVDEHGQVHYGNAVPKAHQKGAQPVDTAAPVPTHAERREAAELAEREKAAAESLRRDRERARVKAAPKAAPAAVTAPGPKAASAPAAISPSSPTTALSDKRRQCEDEMKRFRQSQDCFAPYRTANGGIRAEAFKHCTEVKMPTFCE